MNSPYIQVRSEELIPHSELFYAVNPEILDIISTYFDPSTSWWVSRGS